MSSRFGIPRTEAMKSLEECDGDILDAVNLLECKGIIKRTSAVYTTHTAQGNTDNYGTADNNVRRVEYSDGTENPPNPNVQRIIGIADDLLKKSIEYRFRIHKDEKQIVSLPVLAVIILAAAAVWVTLPALIVGLLAGCRYEIIKE